MRAKAKVALVSLVLVGGLTISHALPQKTPARPGQVITGVVVFEGQGRLELNAHPRVCEGKKDIYVFHSPYTKTDKDPLDCGNQELPVAKVRQR